MPSFHSINIESEAAGLCNIKRYYHKNLYKYRFIKDEYGAFTIETALITPIFIIVMLIFIYMVQYVYVRVNINDSLYNAAMCVSLKKGEGYQVDASTLSSICKDNVNVNSALGVKNGFNAKGKLTGENGSSVDVYADYKFNFPTMNYSRKNFNIRQQCKLNTFIGNQRIKGSDRGFMTKNGKVYHMYSSCSYIRIDVNKLEYTSIIKNNKYKECNYCAKHNENEEEIGFVYVTNYGDVYHYTDLCSYIYRDVYVVDLDSIPGVSLCQRCASKIIE